MVAELTATTIPGVVLARAREIPDKVAVVEATHRTTYSGLAQLIDGSARAMLAAGVGRGDRVAIWAPNSTRWIAATLGAQAVGAAMVPINTRYKSAEAAYPLVRTGAKILIAAPGFMGMDPQRAVDLAVGDGAAPMRIIDIAADDGASSWQTFLDAGEGIESTQWRQAMADLGPDDLSDIMFTSGSTGRPKGVRHRHGPTVRQTFNTIAENGIVADDRYLIVNPFFHVFGYTGGWVPGFFAGCTIYPQPVFDVDTVLETIEAERITYFPGPPTIFHSLLEHPDLDDHDVSSLRLSLTGSADVPVELIQRMLDRLTFDRVIQAYGMTECGTATYTLPTDSAEVVATTVGVACTDLELRIVNEDNEPVATGEAGEIVVRGYAVMDRYLDDDSATAATIDSEGWLHTGDKGMCNADGYYKILGRIKEMIIVGGFNVYPAEVEDMMREHPDIEDAAIIAVPDARLGEVVCAFIVTRVPIEPDQFVAWCRERMANFKVPRYVEALKAFPLTGSNKVSKVDLHEMAASRKIGVSDVT